MKIVVLDPGHGGATTVGGSSPNNAVGPKGTLEKTLTLDVAQRMLRHLLPACDARLTRSSDTNLGLVDRARLARDAKAAVFLSIHFNAFADSAIQGTETLIHPNCSESSVALATTVHKKVLAVTHLRDRGVKRQQLGVLDPVNHDSVTAACLAELSFLTDPHEEVRLQSEAYKEQLAIGAAAGILEYLAA